MNGFFLAQLLRSKNPFLQAFQPTSSVSHCPEFRHTLILKPPEREMAPPRVTTGLGRMVKVACGGVDAGTKEGGSAPCKKSTTDLQQVTVEP